MKSNGENSTIGTIILAAGASSRLGRSKQLLSIKGKKLLRHACEVALDSSGDAVIVVLGHDAPSHQSEIQELPVYGVVNEEWKNGIGSSIKSGLRHLLKVSSDIDAAVIMVCDQPHVTSLHLNRLIEVYRKTAAPVVASSYAATVGVPALFDRRLFSDMLNIDDTSGAKKLIQINSGQAETIALPLGEFDIDTPEDLLRHKQSLQ